MRRTSGDGKADAARRVDAELEHHVVLTTEELVAAGLDRASARREAERRFGDRRAHAEACVAVWEKQHRTARRRQIVRGIGGDLRYATRGLRKNPAFAAVAVATLVLGIGANTAVFSLVRSVLLRPLPYPDPDRLTWIYTSSPPHEWAFSVADFLAFEEQQTSFEGVAAFMTRGVTFNTDQIAERVLARFVTADFFAALGRLMATGRGFTRAEGRPGAERTVVVSHGFWQRYLGARVDVLGQPIRLDATDYSIIGVLPAEVGPLEERAEVFPILQPAPPPRKGPFFLRVVGRRKVGVGAEIAAAELRAINERIFPVWQASYQDSRATWGSKPLRESLVQNARNTLFVLLGAVALVLLVACTNVANLMLTRTAERQGEIAVRRALGATSTRLARQLLVEALFVATIGGAGGIALASLALGAVRRWGADSIPRLAGVQVDGWVLAFTLAVAVGCGVVMGTAPALVAGRSQRSEALSTAGLRLTESRKRQTLRRLFVVVQFAMVVPLLFGAGLLARSLTALSRVDPGYDPANVVTVRLSLPAAAYSSGSDIRGFWEEVLPRLGAVPGVRAVGLADGRPPAEASNWNNFDLHDDPTPPGQSQPVTPWLTVTPGFFDVLGVPLIRGRLLNERDRNDSLPAVVVDQAWARRFFPGEEVVGRRFWSGGCGSPGCPVSTVVGVVGDVKFAGLEDRGVGTVYYPNAGSPQRTTYLFVRTEGEPLGMLTDVRTVIRSVDPTLALSGIATATELLDAAVTEPRHVAIVVGLFALMALLVGGVGIYGVMSYFVRGRVKDIGVRVALGGAPADVFRLIVVRGLLLAAIGCGLGMVGALVVSRLLSGMLFGVGAGDPATLAAVVVLLLAVAALACTAPACRASRVDPMTVLRRE